MYRLSLLLAIVCALGAAFAYPTDDEYRVKRGEYSGHHYDHNHHTDGPYGRSGYNGFQESSGYGVDSEEKSETETGSHGKDQTYECDVSVDQKTRPEIADSQAGSSDFADIKNPTLQTIVAVNQTSQSEPQSKIADGQAGSSNFTDIENATLKTSVDVNQTSISEPQSNIAEIQNDSNNFAAIKNETSPIVVGDKWKSKDSFSHKAEAETNVGKKSKTELINKTTSQLTVDGDDQADIFGHSINDEQRSQFEYEETPKIADDNNNRSETEVISKVETGITVAQTGQTQETPEVASSHEEQTNDYISKKTFEVDEGYDYHNHHGHYHHNDHHDYAHDHGHGKHDGPQVVYGL